MKFSAKAESEIKLVLLYAVGMFHICEANISYQRYFTISFCILIQPKLCVLKADSLVSDALKSFSVLVDF